MASVLSNDSSTTFVRENAVKFHQVYELVRVIGCGTYSTVYECRNTERGGVTLEDNLYAVKVINAAGAAGVVDEIEALRTVADGAYCLRIQEVFDERSGSDGLVYIITELASGVSLLSFLGSGRLLTESEARVLARQLLTSCEAMHSRGIMHRDIKPENILLLDRKNLSAGIRLADFGLATRFTPGELLHDPCGSPLYVAPEVVTAKADPRSSKAGRRAGEYALVESSTQHECAGYGPAADIWSCGVVLYNMISGAPPFYDQSVLGLFHRSKTADASFKAPAWKEVSAACKDFIRQCLTKDPKRRMPAAKALSHRWLAESGDESSNVRDKILATAAKIFR